MLKGPSCQGCPAYEFSRSFVPDEIRPGAPVYLLNQNPGEEEEVQGIPMVGKTGQAWEEKFLPGSGLSREDCSIGNAIRCRWHGSNDLPPVSQTLVKEAIAHCQRAHFKIPEGTKLLIAAGDYASLALTGTTVADGDKAGSGWRGYVRPFQPLGSRPETPTGLWMPSLEPDRLPVLSTWHVARTFHQSWWTIPTKMDWAKVGKILNGTWPRTPPVFKEWAPSPWPQMFTFDTEFDRDTKELHRYSMAWGLGDKETCVIEARNHLAPRWLQEAPRVVVQYSPADVRHLDDLTVGWGSHVWDRFLIEDAVWKHAVLWSDHQHDLNYLGSLYSSFNRWKHLGSVDPTLYAGLDATGLLEVDQSLEQELDRDPLSRKVWTSIDRPALGVFVRAQYRGIRVNSRRVAEAVGQLEKEVIEAQRKARAIVGWPIKLSSNPMVERRLYQIEGAREPR